MLAFLTLVLAGLHIRALSYTDESCDIPLREWMAVTIVALFMVALPWLIIETCLSDCLAGPKATSCYKTYYIILGSLLGIWSAIGLWMLSSDDTCAYDFSYGYDMSVITCGIFFAFAAVTMPLGFLAEACGWFEPKKKGYEPLE